MPRPCGWLKLALAVGASAEGVVRSNVRKAHAEGASPERDPSGRLAAITTVGFPAAIAALGWADDVLEA